MGNHASQADSIRVLHVDDDPQFRDLTATFLERKRENFEIVTAEDADDGMAQVMDSTPDCIVSDYDMPGKDGIEFLEGVREGFPELPFVLFTGKGSEEVASDAISAGVTDYLQKGSGSDGYELLANRIENAVQARRNAKRADRQEELMRLTEVAGETGGFELEFETGDLVLTDGARRLAGISEDRQICLEDAIEMYHPEDQKRLRDAIDSAAERGETNQGTYHSMTEGGDERLVEITMTPVTENGEVSKVRGAVNDITEQRERQQELEQIETLFENAQDSLFLIDVGEDFTVERVNPAYEDSTGMSAETVLGQTPKDILGEETGGFAEKKYTECVENRQALAYDEKMRMDGRMTHWKTKIAPVELDGEVEYIVGSTRDVTDQRERQQELQLLQKSVDGAKVSIALTDPSKKDNPLVYVNDAFEEMAGRSEEEIIGRNCRFLQGEDTDPEKVAALREAIDNEEPVTVELRNYRKDGTEFWNQVTVNPIYDEEGDLVRYLGTQEDITERKERERELEEERSFTQQALDSLDDAFYVLDTDGNLQRWNEVTTEESGYTDSELSEMRAFDIFPEDEHEKVSDAIKTTFEDGRAIFEAEILTADGERVPYEFAGARLTDDEGNTTGLAGIGRNLTERRKREQELREYGTIIDSLSDAVYVLDEEGRFTYVNDEFVELVGYEKDTVIGNTPSLIKDEKSVEKAEDHLGSLLSRDGPESVVFEAEIQPCDGEPIICEDHMGVLPYEGESFEGSVGTLRDITDRKRREQELEENRYLMSRMEQMANVGAWQYDPDEETLTFTDGAYRIYGLEPGADLTLDEAFEYFSPEDREKLREVFTDCLETGEPYETEVQLIAADGTQKWVTARGERVEDGSNSGYVVRGYTQDITEIRESQKELQRIKSQYEVLAENFPDGAVFLVDDDLRYVRARGEELWESGLSPEDIEGKKPHDIFAEEVADETVRYYQRSLAGEKQTFEQEYGGERYRIQSVPVSSEDGGVEYLMAVSKNVTEQAEKKRELRRQNERLDEFVSIVSHDLRSPLSVAEGRLELAREECDNDNIDAAIDAIERGQALIEDLLTLAREGKEVSETVPVELADVAEDCWENVETESATVSVETNQTVQADRSRLRQLLENLYRNATEHAGEDVTVRLGETEDGFYVEDDGPGIPEEKREEVFEAGYSTREDGTGFGLRIVEQVAEAHGWEVRVTEAEKGGARFEVTGVEAD